MLSEETVVYFSSEQAVRLDYLGKLLQDTHFLSYDALYLVAELLDQFQ